MSPEELAAEIERLEAKLAASRGRDGLADRMKAIEERLAELRNAG